MSVNILDRYLAAWILRLAQRDHRPPSAVVAEALRLYEQRLQEEIEGEEWEEQNWLRLASHNPAFAFLHEPSEDIYTLEDGEPFHDVFLSHLA